MDFKELSGLYGSLRSYAEHEDHLINQRLGWCLLVSSFLLSALAIMSSRVLQVEGTIYFVFLTALSIVGGMICWSSLQGIRGASNSLRQLDEHWNRFAGQPDFRLFPVLIGGGPKRAKPGANRSARMICWTLLTLWGIAFVVGFTKLAIELTPMPST